MYHQELAVLARFFNDVDRFMHAATFGEGERFAYTRELMAVLRAVFLGQIEGRPMGVARLSRHLAMPRATTERKLRELQKRGLVSRYGRGFIIPVDSLNQPRMVETLERLILMIHKASVKLPKTGLNKLTVIDCGCVYRESRCGRNDDEASRESDVSMLGYVCRYA